MKSNPIEDRRKIVEARMKVAGLPAGQLLIGSDFNKTKNYVSTGSSDVDNILGDFPGIPDGSVVEFCGESGSGKTYLALKTAAEMQKRNKRVLFLNIEKAFYSERARTIGVEVDNFEKFELAEGDAPAEVNGQFIIDSIKSGEYGLIIIDSITAMTPSADYAKTLGEASKVGAHAKFVADFVRRVNGVCHSTETTLIIINQFRYGAGIRPGTFAKKGTGGEGLPFYCHLRLWINKINSKDGAIYNSDKEIIGGKSRVQIVKNRYGRSKIETQLSIFFNEVEKPDALVEFLMRAKSEYNGYITESRKTLKYVVPDTGEVIESKDPKLFIQQLKETPSPSKKSKNDMSQNAFDYICGKIKFNSSSINELEARLHDNKTAELPEDAPDFDKMSSDEIANMLEASEDE